jgi:hypothetical protein
MKMTKELKRFSVSSVPVFSKTRLASTLAPPVEGADGAPMGNAASCQKYRFAVESFFARGEKLSAALRIRTGRIPTLMDGYGRLWTLISKLFFLKSDKSPITVPSKEGNRGGCRAKAAKRRRRWGLGGFVCLNTLIYG